MIPKISSSHKNDLKKQLESMPFEEARKKVLQNELYDPETPGQIYCLSWLESMETDLRDAREKETLSIAKEANLIASDALSTARKNERWALYAVIIAIVATIIAAMAYIKTP
jgi:uncharacterized membrane protein